MPGEGNQETPVKGNLSTFPSTLLVDQRSSTPVSKNLLSSSLSPPAAMSPEDVPSTSPLAVEERLSTLSHPGHRMRSPSPTRMLSSPSLAITASFNLTCMTCHTHFTSAEQYARHHCVSSSASSQHQEMNESSSDVERFDGKIVYNPDGSAYIIDSEMSDDDTVGLELPHQEGSIEDSQRHPLPASAAPAIPPIANAIYVTKNNRAFYSALYGQTITSLLQENKVPDVPIVHSYRVFNVGDKDSENDCIKSDNKHISSSEKKLPLLEQTQVPIKPILMCFICKLSFGYVKSFIAHAMGDHSIMFLDEETDVLSSKNASAIIQNAGREKEPRVSFLEPVSPPEPVSRGDLATFLPSRHSRVASPTQQTKQLSEQPLQPESSPQLHIKREEERDHIEHSEDFTEEHATISVKREFTDMFDALRHQHQQHLHNSLQSHQFGRDDPFPPPQPVRTPEASRKSPISSLGTNGRASLSPVTSISPNNFSPLQSSLTQLTGTVIGACPEHMSGRPQGTSCDKCDMILQQSRQLGGQMAFMHSRNSCKTLKCPKCNWHYKYQETLEIHMKEKHPENESTCIYCLTSQPHPRLARGETYTCGYKPYRCEVCNYSTTTKGNLSIHMQSDKHLNNMQELQNGGLPNMDGPLASGSLSSVQQQSPSGSVYSAPKTPTPSSTPAGGTSPASHQKPKPMWRCDVCNYETNVARNLRIHMTSEKHTHNMMVLQQNVKHMQQLNALQGGGGGGPQLDPIALLQYAQNPAAAAAMMASMGVGHEKPPVPEVALADLAYNQALLIQMMSGGQIPGHGNPLGPGPMPPTPPGPGDHMGPHFDLGLNPESLEPPPEPVPPNPKHAFTCCVCSAFHTDSLEQLTLHLQLDRSKTNENEVLLVVAGNYICKLCSYKTNLKANFQLHCKTDKHLQKLQHVNHILEGGHRNEWKLKYLANTNPMHVRCNLCEYYTNSVHKLQLHAAHQRHEVLFMLFRHLCSTEVTISDDRRHYKCMLCAFSTKAKLQLLHHIRSVRHLQMEQLHQLQRHAEGKGGTQQDIGDIFRVEEGDDEGRYSNSPPAVELKEDSRSPDHVHACPFCIFTSDSERSLQNHVEDEHGQEKKPRLTCPLCEEVCPDLATLERHAINIHSVNSEGLQRLLLLVRLSAAAKRDDSFEDSSPQKSLDDSRISNSTPNDISHKHSQEQSKYEKTPDHHKNQHHSLNERDAVSYKRPSQHKQVHQKREEGLSTGVGADAEGSSRDEDMTERGSRGTSDEREKEHESGRNCNSTAPTPVPRSTPTPTATSVPPTTPTPTSTASSGTMIDPPMSSTASGLNVPHMAEMAAALNALTAAQMQQLHFNPMMMAGLGLAGLPLHLNPLAAMNLQPPLMPMLSHHMLDSVSLAGMSSHTNSGPSNTSSLLSDPSLYIKQQQLLQQQQQQQHQQQQQQQQHQQQQQQQQQQQAAAAAAAAAAAQQKRARTRITDDQLKILRGHFDINNSPSEEQINEMAKHSGLPPKVIKHWFRNTLFKERQRCKDSPYNFSIPPSTTLNLEEYEKTGEAKVMMLNSEESKEIVALDNIKDEDHVMHDCQRNSATASPQPKVPSLSEDSSRVQEKSEEASGMMIGVSTSCINNNNINADNNFENNSFSMSHSLNQHHQQQRSHSPLSHHAISPPLLSQHQHSQLGGGPLLVSSASSSPLSHIPISMPSPFTSLASTQASLSLSSIISSQLEANTMLKYSQSSTVPSSGLIPPHSGVSPTPPQIPGFPSTPPTPTTSASSASSGKRANRTRFTDYQIKVLQEFFENNAYPKDDDLEYLSKLLNLSPRVIVVWFQNARQKARKVYENQPPIDPTAEENSGRFTRTPGLNYQCKKCLLVFQRYYELIRHQKTHCFKEEDAKRSAQAQAAAAQAAALYADDNSNNSSITESSQNSREIDPMKNIENNFQCDKCNLSFNRFEQWREHQIVHLMNPALFLNKNIDSPFSSLQQQSQHSNLQQQSPLQQFHQISLPDLPLSSPPPSQAQHTQPSSLPQQTSPLMMPASPCSKRKADESEDEKESSMSETQRDKRLRTTILPEQLDYLYQKYQIEANPSRKMLETIAQEVGLKKRVVQVWFQNTRARERKEVSEDSIAKYHEEAIRRYLNDVNLVSEGGGSMKREGETPLDLSKPFDLVRPLGLDSSNFNDGTSNDRLDYWSDDEGCQLEISEHEEGENGNFSFESNPGSPASSTTSSAKQNALNKRFRTQMSGIQVKLMKTIFNVYKTPTMAECEMFGREVGLAKRVIQVWFQNARAKEKKAKLALQKVLGTEAETPKPPDECRVCNYTYSHKYSIQDHLFTREHIENMKRCLEKAKEDNDISRSLTPGNHVPVDEQRTPSGTLAHHLQMAQLMALSSQSQTTTALEEKKSSSEDDLNRLQLLHQMYQQMGLGGLQGAPHPLLQHAMMAGAAMSNVVDQVNYRGTHLSLLQIPVCARSQLEELINTNGSSKASFTLDGAEPNTENAEELEGEVGWVCKICRLVFPSKSVMTFHRSLLQHTKGILKLTQLLYYCSLCKTTSTTALEYRSHLEGDKHKNSIAKPSADKDDAEVADVVRQITALTEAAQPNTTQLTTELPQKIESHVAPAEAKTSTDQDIPKCAISPVNESLKTQHNDVITLGNKCLEKTIEEKEQELTVHLGFPLYVKFKTNEKDRFSNHELSEEKKLEAKHSQDTHCNNIKEQLNIQGKVILAQEAPTGTPVVCTQEMVSTYNDCSYNEHSISFITNPNYTPPAYPGDSYIPYNKQPPIGHNMSGGGEADVHRDYNQHFFVNQNTDYQYEGSVTSNTECHLQNYCYGTYSPCSANRKYQQPFNMTGYLDNYHHQPEVNNSISNFGMESKKCSVVSNQLFMEPTPIKESISASARFNSNDDGMVRSVGPTRSGSILMQMDQANEYMHNVNFHQTSASQLPPSQVLPPMCEKVTRTDANANISRSVPSSTETQSNYL